MFAAHPPDRGDVAIGGLYLQLALIDRFVRAEPRLALEQLRRGLALVEAERARQEDPRAGLEVKDQLWRMELDTLLQTPELHDEALVAFAQAVEENPKDIVLLMAYASLVERSDLDRALSLYEHAWELDPSQSLAAFNLGVLHYNRAADVSARANELDDFVAAEGLMLARARAGGRPPGRVGPQDPRRRLPPAWTPRGLPAALDALGLLALAGDAAGVAAGAVAGGAGEVAGEVGLVGVAQRQGDLGEVEVGPGGQGVGGLEQTVAADEGLGPDADEALEQALQAAGAEAGAGDEVVDAEQGALGLDERHDLLGLLPSLGLLVADPGS